MASEQRSRRVAGTVKSLIAKTNKFIESLVSGLTPAKRNKVFQELSESLKKVVKKPRATSGSNTARHPPSRSALEKDLYVGHVALAYDIMFEKKDGRARGPRKKPTWVEKVVEVPWNAPNKPTPADLDRMADEEGARIADYGVIDIKEKPEKREVKVVKLEKDAPTFAQRKAKRAGALPISGYGTVVGDRNEDMCAFDFVRDLYGDTHKTMCRSDEYIGAVMTGGMGVRWETTYVAPTLANFQACYEGEKNEVWRIMQQGATPLEMSHVAAYVGATCKFLDEDNRVVVSHRPRTQTRTLSAKPMIATVRGGHLHPVTNPGEIKRICQYQDGPDMRAPKLAAVRREAASERCSRTEWSVVPLHVQTVPETMAAVRRLVREHGALPAKVGLSDNGITRLSFYEDDSRAKGIIYDFPGMYNLVQFLLKRLGVDKPKALSLGAVGSELARRHLPHLKKSCPNPAADAWLRAHNARNNAMRGTYVPPVSQDALRKDVARGNLRTYDIARAYTHAMYCPMSEWGVLDANATPVPYDNTPVEELPVGLYYAETEDVLLLGGNRVYVREELQLAAELGVPFTIVAMLLATDTMPKDTLRPFLTAVVALTHTVDVPAELEEDVRGAGKAITNAFYGCLGKVVETEYKDAHISEEFSDACGYANARKVKGLWQSVSHRALECDGRELHIYAVQEVQKVLTHNQFMMQQVQGWNNVRMWRMRKALGGVPVAAKTDAWMLRGVENPDARPDDLIDVSALPQLHEDPRVDAEMRETMAKWGSYRREEEPFLLPEGIADRSMPGVQVLPRAWEDHPEVCDSAQVADVLALVDTHLGLFVEGGPGTGKSWLAREIMKVRRVLPMAPTHKASNNLGGLTIHAALGIGVAGGAANRRVLRKMLRDVDIVIVDETSMVGCALWTHVNVIRETRRDIKFLFLGDFDQLDPVEGGRHRGFDYSQHPTLKELAGYQRARLTRDYRCEPALKAVSVRASEPGFSMRDHFPLATRTTDVHMAITHAVVFYVNNMVMLERKPQDAIHIAADPLVDRTQDVWLYPGLRLLSCVTTRVSDAELPEDASLMEQLRARVDVQNNEAFTVVEVAEDTYTTSSLRDGKVRVCEVAAFHKQHRPGYCFTVHKAQGDTIGEDFTIWEADRMPPKHRLVAVTRAQRLAQISLGVLPSDFGRARDARIRKNLQAKLSAYRSDDVSKGRPPCDVTVEDFLGMLEAAGDCCAHCGEGLKLLDFVKGDRGQVTLDRVDNAGGHTRGNVVVACLGCNQGHGHELEHLNGGASGAGV
jgi:hypothetical protein